MVATESDWTNKMEQQKSPDPLCDLCAGMFSTTNSLTALLSESGFEHYQSRESLDYFAKRGCPLCRIVSEEANKAPIQDEETGQIYVTAYSRCRTKPHDPEQETETQYDSYTSRNVDTNEVANFDLTHIVWHVDQYISVVLSVFTGIDDDAAACITQRPVVTDFQDEVYFDLARTWLRECRETHSCPSEIDSPVLPTRLIDVDLENSDYVRLHLTTKQDQVEYVAMSYCWGRTPFLMTKKENLDQMLEGIPIANLPPTFKDAVMATRALGFRFVWIDALCIIQDDVDDKIREIAGMGDIYKSSSLTITAAAGKSVYEGFLFRKEQPPSVGVPYLCSDGRIGTIQLTVQKSGDLLQESTYSRAWCLQEALLSARNLIYTQNEPVWQCRTSNFKRARNTHVHYELLQSSYNLAMAGLPRSMFVMPNAANPKTEKSTTFFRMGLWRSIVEAYTRRDATVKSDKFPALAGVAELVQRYFDDEYLAGLWKSIFVECLCWQRKTSEPVSIPVDTYRAPSWSWACLDGPVQYSGSIEIQDNRNKAQLLSFEVQPTSSTIPLGEIKSASVRISAYMIQADTSPLCEHYHASGLSPDRIIFRRINADRPDHTFKADLLEAQMALLGECLIQGSKARRTIGLVLVPVAGEEMVYRRIGIFDVIDKTILKAFKTWNLNNRKEFTII